MRKVLKYVANKNQVKICKNSTLVNKVGGNQENFSQIQYRHGILDTKFGLGNLNFLKNSKKKFGYYELVSVGENVLIGTLYFYISKKIRGKQTYLLKSQRVWFSDILVQLFSNKICFSGFSKFKLAFLKLENMFNKV